MNTTEDALGKPALLTELMSLLAKHESAYGQKRVFNRALALVMAELFAFGRHTITQLLLTLGIVDEECARAAGPRCAAVEGKLEAHGGLARGQRRLCGNDVVIQTNPVVAVGQLVVPGIERPAAEATALSDNHPFGAAFWKARASGRRASVSNSPACCSTAATAT